MHIVPNDDSPNSTWPVTSRHDTHVRLISQQYPSSIIVILSVNLRFDLDYLHSEPRR